MNEARLLTEVYRGPRKFSPDNPELFQRQMDALVEELIQRFRALSSGPPRYQELPKVTSIAGQFTEATAGFGCFLPVDTSAGGTVRVRLPPADSRFGGQSLVIIRLSNVGGIDAVPTGDSRVANQRFISLSGDLGAHALLFDGRLWWPFRTG